MINTMWIGKPNIVFKSFINKVVVVTELQSIGYGHPMVNFRVLDEGRNYNTHNRDFLDMFEEYEHVQ